jgi:hypothetical protein
MGVKNIKGFSNYYIYKGGYVVKIYGKKEIIVPIVVNKTVPKISIEKKSYNFIFLMIEYFGEKIITSDEQSQYRYKYKLVDGKIPFESIKLVKYNSNKHTDLKMFAFKCKEKSISANSRVMNISTISENDVFDSLLRTNFRCAYCNQQLNQKVWELDHIEPISKGGLNTPNNLAPSCKKCNRMKSDIDLIAFVHRCKMISLNFSDSEYLTGYNFNAEKTKVLDNLSDSVEEQTSELKDALNNSNI